MSDRFEQIADRYLKVALRSGKEWMCGCPFCNGSDCLQFNIEKGLFVCFTCGQGGTAKYLVNRLGGTYTDPAISVEVLRAALDGMKMRKKHAESKQEFLPESSLARYGGRPHEYWTDARGFDLPTIKRWGLGYDPLTDRCTIAYRDVDGRLLGVIQRRLDDVFPRYLYPKGFDRSGSLFGSWEVTRSQGTRASIVEGSTDVVQVSRTGTLALGQFGSSTTARQVRLLRQLGIKELVLFYDYDIAGRKAEKQAREVLEGFLLRRVEWDEDEFCWENKLCGCDEDHEWFELGFCRRPDGSPATRNCKCGRRHNVDPGKLTLDEISDMQDAAKPVGRIKWQPKRSVKSRSARRSRTEG